MRIFDFTAADLEANRAKTISERQAKTLKQESVADRIAVRFAIFVGLIIAGIVGFGIIVFPQGVTGGKTSPEGSVSWIAIALILVFLFLRYRSNQRSTHSDLERGRAGMVEGIATWQRVIKQKNYIYQITVDGKTFRVEKQTFRAFEAFMELKNKSSLFRIYFAPEISRILSMEIIPQ